MSPADWIAAASCGAAALAYVYLVVHGSVRPLRDRIDALALHVAEVGAAVQRLEGARDGDARAAAAAAHAAARQVADEAAAECVDAHERRCRGYAPGGVVRP